MSEEKEVVEQDGTWSGIKKTIIGVASTAILGVGTWATTKLTGGDSEEKAAPAQPSIIINNTQQQQQQAAASGGKTVVIKEAAKPAQPAPAPKKKEGDEFKEKPAQW